MKMRNRIGETKTMKNGMQATIIAYRHCNDIDVKFENGSIVQNKRYSGFMKGLISN